MLYKFCRKCQTEKPVSSFYRQHTLKDGLQTICKQCSDENKRNWLKQHREHVSKQQREYNHYWRQTAGGKYLETAKRCKKQGQPFNWNRADFIDWYNTQERNCHYCGVTLTLKRGSGGEPTSLTLDRKDNKKGYSRINTVLACMRCNLMKGGWLTEEQMLDAARRYFNV